MMSASDDEDDDDDYDYHCYYYYCDIADSQASDQRNEFIKTNKQTGKAFFCTAIRLKC